MHPRRGLLRGAIILVAFKGRLFGQDRRQVRVLRGRVTDGKGNSIRNAAVTLKRSDSEFKSCCFTGPKGTFRFENLSARQAYEIQASYAGQSSRVTPVHWREDQMDLQINLMIPSMDRSP